ncbi:hypothetical protein F3C99_12495 [Vitellibacter sp. q18]|nr:hypothetical protein [Aequorivita lutea]
MQVPMNYKVIGNYFKNNSGKIELMALGSSQMKCAFNPALSSKKAINFGSSSQHHNEDFEILKGTIDRIPKLKYILMEVSFNHLELPHHPADFWKNNVYLKYYNVNAFGRATWFKDRLIYLSNPRFYSHKIFDYYFVKDENATLNKYGFYSNNFRGSFQLANYDEKKIAANVFRISNRADITTLRKNSTYLFHMLDFMQQKNLTVIIATIPLYKTYVEKRKAPIVNRRDSILSIIKRKYKNVVILNEETDTLKFTVTDFLNENHLNPYGAEKFTLLVNQKLDSLDQRFLNLPK